MAIDPVSFLPINSVGSPDSVAQPGKANFSNWLEKELGDANKQIIEADTQLRSLAIGNAENLHQVMIDMEKAKLNFSLVVQVRNKLLEAYQDIMRMQV